VTATHDTRIAAPLAVYATGLRRAAAGLRPRLVAADHAGGTRELALTSWCGRSRPGDAGLLCRCTGATLDVGCGPGRLAGRLAAGGHPALGIDISPAAVRMARRLRTPVLLRDAFGPVPGEGFWETVLLADGNIGIGGDPSRLLRRCRDLTAPNGSILVEVDPPGSGTWAGHLRITVNGRRWSAPFPWAYVDVDHLAPLAAAAGLAALTTWTEAGRWFTALSRR
jgi:SAM-dependent methyltransferase